MPTYASNIKALLDTAEKIAKDYQQAHIQPIHLLAAAYDCLKIESSKEWGPLFPPQDRVWDHLARGDRTAMRTDAYKFDARSRDILFQADEARRGQQEDVLTWLHFFYGFFFTDHQALSLFSKDQLSAIKEKVQAKF